MSVSTTNPEGRRLKGMNSGISLIGLLVIGGVIIALVIGVVLLLASRGKQD